MSLRNSDWTFFRHLLMAAGMAGLAYVVWRLSGIFILLFAAILLAILLRWFAELLASHSFVPRRWSLAVVAIAIAAAVGGAIAIFGAQIAGQVEIIFSRLPEALNAAGDRLGIANTAERVEQALASARGGQLLTRAASIGYTVIGALADFLLVVVTAIYLASDPQLYRRGFAKLFPHSRHGLILDAMSATAGALRLWFLGQLVSMILVGVLSGLAFWIIGLPAPIGLGFIAGLTNFIPLLGPIVGAVPALLISFTLDTTAILWTLAAIVVIQQVEGYFIMPIIQQRAVDVPPAVVLFALAAFGTLFGWLGVVFAVPLAVTLMVLIQKLWIRETLGEPTHIAGGPDGNSA